MSMEGSCMSVQTAAGDVYSVPIDLGDEDRYSISVNFTDNTGLTATGTLYLQARNTETEGWTVVASSNQAVNAAVDASHIWSVVDAGYRYVRVFWDYTAGVALIQANYIVKNTYVRGA